MEPSNKFLIYATSVLVTLLIGQANINRNPVVFIDPIEPEYYQASYLELSEEEIFRNSIFDFKKKSDQRNVGNKRVVYEVSVSNLSSTTKEEFVELYWELKNNYPLNTAVIVMLADPYNRERICMVCENGSLEIF